MRVLVTGASGMLGSTLVERWRHRHDVFATARAPFETAAWRVHPFDLAQADHRPLIEWAQPDAIVHCAAWTALDACEADPERALDHNGKSVGRLLAAAPAARMLFVSSDAVLGDRDAPLDEAAPAHPLNAYGRAKLLGEQLVGSRGASIRTTVIGWNVDPRKQSFLEWIVRSLERGDRLTLFRDALFNPIAASHFADELERMFGDGRTGVWHVTGREATSKYDFGMALAGRLGLDRRNIAEGTLAAATFVARRSADQRLSVDRYEASVGRRLPTLDETIDALVRDRS